MELSSFKTMRKAGKCQTSLKTERWMRRCSWVAQKWQSDNKTRLEMTNCKFPQMLPFYEMCFHKLLFKMNVQEGKKQLHLIPTWVKTYTTSVSRCDCVGLNEVSFHPYACRSTRSLEIQYLPSKCKYTQHMPDKKKQNPSLEGVFFKLLSTLRAVHGRPPPSFER